jgi:hypothetical protein
MGGLPRGPAIEGTGAMFKGLGDRNKEHRGNIHDYFIYFYNCMKKNDDRQKIDVSHSQFC